MAVVKGVPGWYVDSLEANLNLVIEMQRQNPETVEDMVERFMDSEAGGQILDKDEHIKVMAISLAILVRKLAQS